jgi:hypothetical protein
MKDEHCKSVLFLAFAGASGSTGSGGMTVIPLRKRTFQIRFHHDTVGTDVVKNILGCRSVAKR